MNLMQELLEMGEYEEEGHKSYDKKEEADEHAQEFLDKAAEVLSHNKKSGDTGEVIKVASQMAKDYHEAILDAISGEKYGGDTSGDMEGSASMDGEAELDF